MRKMLTIHSNTRVQHQPPVLPMGRLRVGLYERTAVAWSVESFLGYGAILMVSANSSACRDSCEGYFKPRRRVTIHEGNPRTSGGLKPLQTSYFVNNRS